ncbi:PIN domain-containing protein [Geminocystis herdmanii]|uniref:PIN domain-containing protein n=1 Tax=Geminocystis herdmanii TaxID=669359 RepID=UPI00034C8C13|nr:PIN domain-containing protein [Geminocystis herdmanii]
MFLVVDANILIGELLRKRGQELIKNSRLTLYISERVFSEANYELNKRINLMIQQNKISYPDGIKRLYDARNIIDKVINIVSLNDYQHLENKAKNLIPRDPNDWETVAISLLLGIDIWTKDCDFIGCGRATWTTETLIYILNI